MAVPSHRHGKLRTPLDVLSEVFALDVLRLDWDRTVKEAVVVVVLCVYFSRHGAGREDIQLPLQLPLLCSSYFVMELTPRKPNVSGLKNVCQRAVSV